MGTILVSAIITSARVTLLDPSPGVTWVDADFLRFVNTVERNACELRPDLYTVRGPWAMAAGSIQTLPAGATVLMDIEENTVSKQRVNLVDLSLVDALNRYWPAATPELDVQEYGFDPRDRKRIRIIPPNNGSGSLNVLYGATPPSLAAVGSAINLDDIHELAILHGVLAEAYSANTKRQDLGKWQAYRGSFKELLGLSAQSSIAAIPKNEGATQ